MGEFIQIRVTANIHDPDKALERWSGLAKTAFGPQQDKEMQGKDLLAQLIDALYDKHRLGQLSEILVKHLSEDIKNLYNLKKKLNSLLADRNPQEADKISYQIEDLLDRMEENIQI